MEEGSEEAVSEEVSAEVSEDVSAVELVNVDDSEVRELSDDLLVSDEGTNDDEDELKVEELN